MLDLDVDAGEVHVTRPDDMRLEVKQLSEGTADQLWLALHLAGIEHHVGRTGPMPVVLDDVLVHLDDARSLQALRVLADLGQRTQVVLFTHHAKVVELARQALAEDDWRFVELERPTSQAPVTVTPQAPRQQSSPLEGRVNRGVEPTGLLLAAIDAVAPRGKSELLARSGLAERDWLGAI